MRPDVRTPAYALVVPQGAEERAVRRAVRRAGSGVAVFTMGVGPLAAARAARSLSGSGHPPGRVIVMGLCGLLAPAFAVGEPLVYGDAVDADGRLVLDADFSRFVAERVPGSLSGVRVYGSSAIVTRATEKHVLGARYAAQAVDMETLAFARALQPRGVLVAALRIGSDGVADDLPDLNRTLDGSGGLDGFALALALLRRPVAGVRLARNGTRALAALERAVYALLAANV